MSDSALEAAYKSADRYNEGWSADSITSALRAFLEHPGNAEVVGNAILDAMNVMNGLDVTSANEYANAAINALIKLTEGE